MQQQLGIGEPIFARIFDTGCFPCGAKLSYRCYANLAVEGELAVRLGQTVSTPPVGVDECRAAITSAFPVIELHHYVLRSASRAGGVDRWRRDARGSWCLRRKSPRSVLPIWRV